MSLNLVPYPWPTESNREESKQTHETKSNLPHYGLCPRCPKQVLESERAAFVKEKPGEVSFDV
jgi:hypothetical protein